MHDLFSSIRRPARRLGLLLGGVLGGLLGAGQPADALTITPVFQNGVPVAAQNVINNVITEYQNDFSNNVNLTIAFGWGVLNGSPITSGAATDFDTSDFLSPFGPSTGFTLAQVKALYTGAAAAPGATQVLVTANANLPAAYPNPGCCGGTTPTNFMIPDAEYKALTGMALDADQFDGFTGYATDFCGTNVPNCAYDFSGGPPPANTIDFKAVVEHELSHAMSRVDFAFSSQAAGGAPPFLTPQDFFKFSDSNGCTKTLDPNFDITCFSFDGGATNPGPRTFSNSSDSGDWINANTDSFNAFIDTGVFAQVSTADILLMCAEGWNDRAVCGTPAVSTPEPGTLALLGTSLLGLAALRRRRRQ
jgi:hypothetical protein